MEDLKKYIDFSQMLSDVYEKEKLYMLECIEEKNNIIHLTDESEKNLSKTQELFKNIIWFFEEWFTDLELVLDLCHVNSEDSYIWISFWKEESMWETYETTWYNIWFKIDFSDWEEEAHFVEYRYEWF